MKVGDLVICINDDFSNIIDYDFTVFDQLPRKGQKYTVRRIENWGVKVRVLLEEIKNPVIKSGFLKGVEPGFCSTRFEKPKTTTVQEEQEKQKEVYV